MTLPGVNKYTNRIRDFLLFKQLFCCFFYLARDAYKYCYSLNLKRLALSGDSGEGIRFGGILIRSEV